MINSLTSAGDLTILFSSDYLELVSDPTVKGSDTQDCLHFRHQQQVLVVTCTFD